MITVGSKVAILVGGRYSDEATHKVTGINADGTLLICPIGQLRNIEPGQNWVPVTQITTDRVQER